MVAGQRNRKNHAGKYHRALNGNDDQCIGWYTRAPDWLFAGGLFFVGVAAHCRVFGHSSSSASRGFVKADEQATVRRATTDRGIASGRERHPAFEAALREFQSMNNRGTQFLGVLAPSGDAQRAVLDDRFNL